MIEQEREEKGIKNYEPLTIKDPLFINSCTTRIKKLEIHFAIDLAKVPKKLFVFG